MVVRVVGVVVGMMMSAGENLVRANASAIFPEYSYWLGHRVCCTLNAKPSPHRRRKMFTIFI